MSVLPQSTTVDKFQRIQNWLKCSSSMNLASDTPIKISSDLYVCVFVYLCLHIIFMCVGIRIMCDLSLRWRKYIFVNISQEAIYSSYVSIDPHISLVNFRTFLGRNLSRVTEVTFYLWSISLNCHNS